MFRIRFLDFLLSLYILLFVIWGHCCADLHPWMTGLCSIPAVLRHCIETNSVVRAMVM